MSPMCMPLPTQGENRDLIMWWARYSESQGDLDTASRLYEKAGDGLSMVRILCYARCGVFTAKVVE